MNTMVGSRVISCTVTKVMQQLQCLCTKPCYLVENVTSTGNKAKKNSVKYSEGKSTQ